jgi:hypothetical protein
VPTYRIYYAERDPNTAVDTERYTSPIERLPGYGRARSAMNETEWEEEVEGRDRAAALEAFFAGHVGSRSDVMWVDANGDSHPIEGVEDYNPDKTYIWIENGKLMEYQGLDEATPGMTACPLCDGAGEVTVEVADEYLGEYGEEIAEREPIEERPTWG